MSDADITSLKQQITKKRVQCGRLAFRYDFGHEAMPIVVGDKITAIESDIRAIEKTLHAIYDVRGMLKPYEMARITVDSYQKELRTQLTKPMAYPSQFRTITWVYPTDKPLVYRIEFPFVCEWHDLVVTCHIDDLMTTLEAMPTVALYGEVW